MDFVIDANVLLGMLISGKASYKQLLTSLHFIAPEFVFVEIEKYKDLIRSKSRLDEIQFNRFAYSIFSGLTFLPAMLISEEVKGKAELLVKDIDSKDTAYVALAIQLDLLLLTNDKPLESGLKKKGFRKVMLFEDFLRSL
jgi:predicted nucleic acid-binding protein